jgi:hypothetical protein
LYRHSATALCNVGAQISGMTQIGATAIKITRTNSRQVLNGLIFGFKRRILEETSFHNYPSVYFLQWLFKVHFCDGTHR